MNKEERTDRLARAIEEMVQGRTPDDLGDEELQELLKIAQIRLDAAHQAANAGADARDSVLERVQARLDARKMADNSESAGLDITDEHLTDIAPDESDPEDVDISDLQEVIGLRREIAEHAVSISEAHRDVVWQRVQARIQASQSEERTLFRWPFSKPDPEAGKFGAALDRMTLGEPIWEAKDSKLSELFHIARLRQAAAMTNSANIADQRARVWSRLRPRLMARLSRSRRPSVFQDKTVISWPKLATAAAGLALVIAALGPIPATGLAHHPAAEFARFLGDRVGVTETSAPPAVPPVTEIIESRDVPAAQASALLGVPVHDPTFIPGGYGHVSSEYFSQAITADEGGVYVIAFEDSNVADNPPSILIYQEQSSSNSIAVEQGFSQNVWLSEGAPATYVRGTWRSTGSDLRWGEDQGQTIVFDLGGVRTVVHATDGDLPLSDLVAIADGLAGQATPPTN